MWWKYQLISMQRKLMSGHQQNSGLESDPTVTKPFLQISWNADGDLLMAETRFQSRSKNIACHPSTGTVFVVHRLRILVYMLETSGTYFKCLIPAEWFVKLKCLSFQNYPIYGYSFTALL